jgi:hypothetical protein
MVLKTDPEDREALLSLAVLPVWFGGEVFVPARWIKLTHSPGFDLRRPVFAALLLHHSGVGTENQLAAFLHEAHAEEAATPILSRVADEGNEFCRKWAVRVLRLISP